MATLVSEELRDSIIKEYKRDSHQTGEDIAKIVKVHPHTVRFVLRTARLIGNVERDRNPMLNCGNCGKFISWNDPFVSESKSQCKHCYDKEWKDKNRERLNARRRELNKNRKEMKEKMVYEPENNSYPICSRCKRQADPESKIIGLRPKFFFGGMCFSCYAYTRSRIRKGLDPKPFDFDRKEYDLTKKPISEEERMLKKKEYNRMYNLRRKEKRRAMKLLRQQQEIERNPLFLKVDYKLKQYPTLGIVAREELRSWIINEIEANKNRADQDTIKS